MNNPEEVQIIKYDIPPVWKTIGEASATLTLFIEQIDGYRVPVRRFNPFFTDQYRSDARIEDQVNQNRVQRDVMREAFRQSHTMDGRDAPALRERYEEIDARIKREEQLLTNKSQRGLPVL